MNFLKKNFLKKTELVKELSPKDFSGLLLNNDFSNKIVLVVYYASWCGHCKSLMPVLNDAANMIKKLKLDSRFLICRFNCDMYKSFIDDINKFQYGYKVHGFPTMVMYKNQVFIKEYNNSRDMNSIMKELTKLN